MGHARGGLATTSTVATLAGGWLLDTIGYRLLLPLGAAFGVVTGVCWLFVRIKSSTHEPRFTGVSALQSLVEDRILLTYTAGWFMWGFGAFMVLPLYPIYLVDHLKASYGEVGILSFVTSGCWLLSFFVWGRRVDRRGGVSNLVLTFALGVLVPLIYAFQPGMILVGLAFAINGVVNAGAEMGWIRPEGGHRGPPLRNSTETGRRPNNHDEIRSRLPRCHSTSVMHLPISREGERPCSTPRRGRPIR